MPARLRRSFPPFRGPRRNASVEAVRRAWAPRRQRALRTVPPFDLLARRRFECERTVVRLADSPVQMDRDAGARGDRVGQGQRARHRALAEQALAAAEHEREDPQAELVDEVVPQQGLDQLAAAGHLQFAAGLALEPRDFGGDVASQQHRMAPARRVERARGDVLAHAVELGRDRVVVADVGPVRGEDLVRLAPEQEGVRRLGPAADQLAHAVVEIRYQPAAVLETAAAVLVRAAGRLHDAVQGEESSHYQFHRSASSSWGTTTGRSRAVRIDIGPRMRTAEFGSTAVSARPGVALSRAASESCRGRTARKGAPGFRRRHAGARAPPAARPSA